MAGCLNLDYPKELVNIYLCDDGRRTAIQSWLRNLAFITLQGKQ
ncbi:hypothetical protein PO124_15755 [Bacillus licheniformis]|nr:hypothetical protein [Bacillus licheniformis]